MKSHYIYVIGREEGPVKVGISDNPHGRLRTLQTGSAVKLKLLHTRAGRDRAHVLWHEETFHVVHKDVRLSGEWFDMPADEAIESVDTSFEYEEHFSEEDTRSWQAAELNIWPWAGEDFYDGAHPHR
jgi:hypothetical protein